jgi:hypothetical protein
MADGAWTLESRDLKCEHWPRRPLGLFAHGRMTGGCWPSYQISPACPASSSHAALNILDTGQEIPIDLPA